MKTETKGGVFDLKSLKEEPSILNVLGREIHNRGFAGQAHIPKLVYLTLLTGMLDNPVSLVIKGPSGAGKSFSLAAGRQFIPETAYEQFEGMSEKAIVYLKGLDLKHRHLIIGEAAGLAEGNGRTLIRQLLSEGKVRYATVQSTSDGLEGSELPELEGPTGLIMTTTATGLHHEDESRMLSVTMRESPEQIKSALMAQALGTSKQVPPLDTQPWFDLYEMIKAGPKQVAVPFAEALVEHLPTTHDRIKRDFPQMLSLIKAHALLHSCRRDRQWKNDQEFVVADADDYSAVCELVNDPISEGLEIAVADGIQMVVNGVQEISGAGVRGNLSLAKLSEHLKRDISVVSRHVRKAETLGYLRNENPGQGKEANLMIGDRKMPNGSVLPTPKELFGSKESRMPIVIEDQSVAIEPPMEKEGHDDLPW